MQTVATVSRQTARLIGGVDEAGRGPLAGPVVAACVVLGAQYDLPGLADSKQLSEKKRNSLAAAIRQHARAWVVASATVAEIDRLNILQATLLAMQRAVAQLPMTPGLIMIDGTHSPKLTIPVRTVIKGDSRIAEISAASILAKTTRDADMMALHQRYPEYGFDRHKGYPTRRHIAALQMYGITDIHRKSFAPVQAIVKSIVNR
ncbi:RNase HII [Nitrosomonas sp. Nm51]|uniref:ribonuclease HII n=1 Tax=Nitrosomonas sp. Nm51 TaxID=133720 RepID=UPI0008D0338A|nr:ribonuclease HII [Nitrosomonas sp. Nm51]SER03618.1 RNase HII [Nitrosomonas sp. Nm51]